MSISSLQILQNRISEAAVQCGRNPQSIKLIAVSKTHPVDAIRFFYDLGVRNFGENKVQELVDKWDTFSPSDLEWHMIGTLQTNKIKYLAKKVNWIHSIAKPEQLLELNKRLTKENRNCNVLIQVNISDEDQKSGCQSEQIPDFLKIATSLDRVVVRGFMGIASLEAEPESVRPQFKNLHQLLQMHKSNWNAPSIQLTELSMGMTNDLEVAIQEGATMIRVGTALFGNRNYLTK